MTKFIVNPVTGEYESTAYTFRDRFDLKNQFSTQGLNDGGRVGFREGTRARNQYSPRRTVEELQLIIDNAPQIKVGDKFLDTPSAAGRPPKVDLGVTNAKTYAMSAAKAPETPVVTDAVAMDDKWTSVAKRLAQIQDTTAIG